MGSKGGLHNSWLFSNEQHKMPGPPLQSLVKYDTPSLLTTKDKKGSKPAKGGKKLPPVEGKPQLTQTEDILNSILPPREWTEEGQLWVQYVSSTPATRLDVINLQELKAKAEAIEKREGERRALEEKKHAEEVQFLKRTNAQLKKELETYLSPTKK